MRLGLGGYRVIHDYQIYCSMRYDTGGGWNQIKVTNWISPIFLQTPSSLV